MTRGSVRSADRKLAERLDLPSSSDTVTGNQRGSFTLENFRRVTLEGQRVAIGDVAGTDLARIVERHITSRH